MRPWPGSNGYLSDHLYKHTMSPASKNLWLKILLLCTKCLIQLIKFSILMTLNNMKRTCLQITQTTMNKIHVSSLPHSQRAPGEKMDKEIKFNQQLMSNTIICTDETSMVNIYHTEMIVFHASYMSYH